MKFSNNYPRLALIAALSWFALCTLVLAEEAPELKTWGREAMQTLDRDLWLPNHQLYAERIHAPDHTSTQPAYMWGVGVQLTALAAAARMEPETYESRLRIYADAVDRYWHQFNGIAGYDVLPGPKDSDRFYDDNAWLVLAMIEIYETTGEKKYLQRAQETFRFVMSGEDAKLGGGLYWRENERKSKNTCTNGPAITSALRLYQLTGNKDYMNGAERLYRWTVDRLRDPNDGLFWDNVRMDGTVDRRKYSYNSALMIRANLLFHQIKKEHHFLQEAQRIARSAKHQWIRDDGGIADEGRFAHLLIEALLMLHEADGEEHWIKICQKTMVFAHEHLRDERGRYPKRWDSGSSTPLREVNILDQASVARAMWMIANAAD